ncbi:MAG: hypothetical protein ABIR30_06475 [Chitinophagaceae bacterium]
MMKFLLIVLGIHLVGELISNKRKDNKSNGPQLMNGKIYHPAEYELR